MRRVYSIILLFCFTAPFFGTYAWLKYEKYKVKKAIKWQMINGMDRGELVLLKFTKEEAKTNLTWEHSREFEYNQGMYDVVEEETRGDTIYYWCWWDHEETKLNRHLSDLVTRAMGHNRQNEQNQNRLQNFLTTLYHSDLNAEHLLPNEEDTVSTACDFRCISFSKIPPTPPPEIAGVKS